MAASPLGYFERYLTVWVALGMAAGVGLGLGLPDTFAAIAALEYANINLPIAVLIWAMIYPMMIGIDWRSLKDVGQKPKGLCLTVFINWLVKPFTMAGLGILFFEGIFADLVAPEDATQYIAGMILLGVAPCTAMVFVWSRLVNGDASYTLVQVSVNDLIMIFAFAPLVALLLGVTDIMVPWETLILSVLLYVVLPLAAGAATRYIVRPEALPAFTQRLKPLGALGLILTVTILFGIQAQKIVENPFVVGLIALPLLIQGYGIFFVAYGFAYAWKLPFRVAAPAALIGTSNFFELAVAVAISLFGTDSGAALATIVGVLVEVPVMLSLVWFAKQTQHRFDA